MMIIILDQKKLSHLFHRKQIQVPGKSFLNPYFLIFLKVSFLYLISFFSFVCFFIYFIVLWFFFLQFVCTHMLCLLLLLSLKLKLASVQEIQKKNSKLTVSFTEDSYSPHTLLHTLLDSNHYGGMSTEFPWSLILKHKCIQHRHTFMSVMSLILRTTLYHLSTYMIWISFWISVD